MSALDSIRARAQAATPGPWFDVVNDLVGGRMVATVDKPAHAIRIEDGDRVVADLTFRDEDTAFIAHVRTDIEVLCDIAEAAGDDASGRPLPELLLLAADYMTAAGDGPVADCLRLKADEFAAALSRLGSE